MVYKLLQRKPGRPRVIPEGLVPKVISLYRQGFGYRAIARDLRQEGISVHLSAVSFDGCLDALPCLFRIGIPVKAYLFLLLSEYPRLLFTTFLPIALL